MTSRTYWLDLFTGTTWDEFKSAGGNVSGFRETRWKTVQKIRPGDYLLCYLTGVSRFIGVLEVTSEPFKDSSPIWKDEEFPCRVKVRIVAELTPDTAIPIHLLRRKLSIFENLTSPNAWTGYFRGSPYRWKLSDGEIVFASIIEAQKDPVVRSVDKRKLARRPRALKARIGSVTVPEEDITSEEAKETPIIPSEHIQIQSILLRLGSDMGFNVWVAINDRNKELDGVKLSDHPNILNELPLQFDDATNRTIELIDVLWLKGNAIVAAFEIEYSTSVYSGLLRMADLVAMQPNLNIPLYLVAPDERRDKVINEINRPTFSKLDIPLSHICRFISFSSLREELERVANVTQYLKPEFLEELSESCEVEEA
ncbi:EVE domain-containing protein [Candidatus Pacearchaeota archaeon]|nr:EVE domain-containing protein [Candidatus Pacearchaeota archaeon]